MLAWNNNGLKNDDDDDDATCATCIIGGRLLAIANQMSLFVLFTTDLIIVVKITFYQNLYVISQNGIEMLS